MTCTTSDYNNNLRFRYGIPEMTFQINYQYSSLTATQGSSVEGLISNEKQMIAWRRQTFTPTRHKIFVQSPETRMNCIEALCHSQKFADKTLGCDVPHVQALQHNIPVISQIRRNNMLNNNIKDKRIKVFKYLRKPNEPWDLKPTRKYKICSYTLEVRRQSSGLNGFWGSI